MSVYQQICQARTVGRKLFALLIDPEKCTTSWLNSILGGDLLPDYIFVGGSQYTDSLSQTVNLIGALTKVPIIMFPGNASQFADNADALLYLFLASGRNPDYLIGQQIKAAPLIHKAGIETISTGYILIDGGRKSAVQTVSNTIPYQPTDTNIICDTAIACELLGCKLIYLEAGSGAISPISHEIISITRKNINIPLIVGGGISSSEQIKNAFGAGADMIVIGNHIETNPQDINLFIQTINQYNNNLL